MDARVSFVTLAVADLEVSRRFYAGGLGWEPAVDVPGEVLMFHVGPRLVLSLWDRSEFEEEVGPILDGDGIAPVTLAHNMATTGGVDAVLADAREAGATVVSEPVHRDWGGYSGYFADPDGFRWEVAYAPGPIGDFVLPDSGIHAD